MFGRNVKPTNPNPNAEEMIEFNQLERQPVDREQLLTSSAVVEDQAKQNALAKMFMGLGNAGATAQGVQGNNLKSLQDATLDTMNKKQQDNRDEKFKRIRDILGVK